MKKQFATICLLLVIVLASSCKKEETTPDRDQFIGTYKGTSTCNNGAQVIVTIAKSSKADNAILITLGTDPIDATVNGSTASIPNQTTSGVTISGNGNMTGSTLTATFNFSSNGQSLSCSFTGTKQ